MLNNNIMSLTIRFNDSSTNVVDADCCLPFLNRVRNCIIANLCYSLNERHNDQHIVLHVSCWCNASV